jgi:hypothetical protein
MEVMKVMKVMEVQICGAALPWSFLPTSRSSLVRERQVMKVM